MPTIAARPGHVADSFAEGQDRPNSRHSPAVSIRKQSRAQADRGQPPPRAASTSVVGESPLGADGERDRAAPSARGQAEGGQPAGMGEQPRAVVRLPRQVHPGERAGPAPSGGSSRTASRPRRPPAGAGRAWPSRGSTTDRSVTIGTSRRRRPSSVAFSTSQSNRSPLGTAVASVRRHGGDAVGQRGADGRQLDPVPPHRRQPRPASRTPGRRTPRPPRPRRTRRTRARWRASSSGRA